MLIANEFKRRLLAKEAMVGTWCMSGSANVVEAMGWTGFDFLTIDGEHGLYSHGEILNSLRALASTPTMPIVRVPNREPSHAKHLLDIGVQSFLVPMVETVEDAKAFVDATRYPPQGHRGFALMHRGSRYLTVDDYAQIANDEICVVVQLESRDAIDRLEDIAAVPGIDAVFVGPGDLSASMGFVGQPSHADILNIVQQVAKRSAAIEVPCGILFNRPDLAQDALAAGYTMVAVGNDLGFLTSTARATAKGFKH
ncbi:HpcH/HpaI aldolase/citrate lyase family protein [Amorphus sp. 3PC139-8]|uniref:HpcH/HpaI aldolase family protein n=1 Tax=Amorphus sp. 3PC139-8 TaxID=2735676 RepID=UPI00345D6E9B